MNKIFNLQVPFDPYRLVFPPFPAAILTTILYQPVRLFDHSQLLLAGGLFGYLCYDMIHYFIHYGNPKGEGYFYTLKRVHNYHHFVTHDKGMEYQKNRTFKSNNYLNVHFRIWHFVIILGRYIWNANSIEKIEICIKMVMENLS
jgi:hypothetical protein